MLRCLFLSNIYMNSFNILKRSKDLCIIVMEARRREREKLENARMSENLLD